MRTFLKSHNTKFLLLFSGFCSILLIFRIVIIDKTYIFLWINLGLAWIPYLLSFLFRKEKIRGLKLVSLTFIWFIFFPNALYVITDLLNCTQRTFASHWYDSIMVLSFAVTSLFLAFGALKNLELFLVNRVSQKRVSFLMFSSIYVGCQGVYFGRFIRLNSWEVFSAPSYVFDKIITVLSHPVNDVNFYGTTLSFTIFIYIFYYGIFHFAKSHK